MLFYVWAVFMCLLFVLVFADIGLDSRPKIDKRKPNNTLNDTTPCVFPFPIPPQSVSLCLLDMRRMRNARGYIFGNIWSALALNLVAYLIAAHVVGGCWYAVAVQRVASCVIDQCQGTADCTLKLACPRETCYHLGCASNSKIFPNLFPLCLNPVGYFRFGIYKQALPIVSSDSVSVKIIYPLYWGLGTASNQPTKNFLEVIFCILVILFRLVLVAMLLGNIKRVRRFERERWQAIGGNQEMELLNTFPQGLQRDIRRWLCFDLVKKVPFFKSLDDFILGQLCDRLKPFLYTSGEKIIRKGQPVDQMIFVIEGRIESTNGIVRTGSLGPGDFTGEEVLLRSLRRHFEDPLPASSTTLVCMETTEVFGLEADDLCNLTERNSANWRTWGAVNIQFAWNRYRLRARGRPAATQEMENGDTSERLLRQCAVMFSSLRPHDHLD
ncbi:hypothetical protein MKW98_020890 [Papaver atlanticum]|uniref:Cyclic nucleotide-binding domain-containing protein n=1 Tax=Papaver atlanticum TaxID=357466 RepID=A0AAD4XVR7_9MAGN|nr:hypothetical protein MKW98_020890 [Papaver atlanticum]